MRKTAAAAVGLNSIVTVCTIMLLAWACRGRVSISPGDPNACSPTIALLSQPTAALALEWHSGGANRTGHNWAAVDRAGAEHFLNVEFVPQGGWTVPPNTRGLAFEMHAHSPDNFGFDDIESIGVVYVLEYTFPKARCAMDASLDATLSIALPNGICVAREGNPGGCTSNDQVRADFQMIAINDPTGTMSVTGAGRTLLENAIESLLSTIDDRSRLFFSGNTQASHRKARGFSGSFAVAQGVSAKVYLGVSAFVQKAPHGWVCTRKCTTAPNDRLVDEALFRVESGTNGEVGVAMTPQGS